MCLGRRPAPYLIAEEDLGDGGRGSSSEVATAAYPPVLSAADRHYAWAALARAKRTGGLLVLLLATGAALELATSARHSSARPHSATNDSARQQETLAPAPGTLSSAASKQSARGVDTRQRTPPTRKQAPRTGPQQRGTAPRPTMATPAGTQSAAAPAREFGFER